MQTTNVHVVFFSATFTTRSIARRIAARLGGRATGHDITAGWGAEPVPAFGRGDVLLAAVPVYAGRVPAPAAAALRRLRSGGAPAVAVCVYGNRDYDDALLELCDLLADGGFSVVGAGAFVARHSIFPMVAAGRPDAADMARADVFGAECASLMASLAPGDRLSPPRVKGNRPYRQPGSLHLHPTTATAGCTLCGLCAAQCPFGAIPAASPASTDAALCMACGRCIAVCPQHVRGYYNNVYEATADKFGKAFAVRREPEWVMAARQADSEAENIG